MGTGYARFAAAVCAAVFGLAAGAQSAIGSPRMMQGPMVGAVGPNEITIWLRLSGEFTAQIEYADNAELTDAIQTEPVTPSRDDDFTCVIPLRGLKPDTAYHYRVLVEGAPARYIAPLFPFTTKTAPAGKARFSVAYGSCPKVQEDSIQPIWNAVNALHTDLFFWVGDNIYGDSLDPGILAEEYRRQRDVAALQPVLRRVPQLAVWDDHDFALNDHDRTNPVKDKALVVFKQYWANPGYGLPGTPGVFFTYSYGGVDFFFVDCRYHRDPNADPDGPKKTFLGAKQLAWLKDGLKASEAAFKVIVSGSGWSNAKGPGGDSWAAFQHERDGLFDYIRDNEIGGVVLLSGDTHNGECNAIPWSEKGGYDFYDLVSSPLAQTGSVNWKNRNPENRVRPGVSAPNAGYIEFDMTAADPTLTFNLYTDAATPAWEPLTLKASELVNGVTSHVEKDRYAEQ